jgi:hypothetical protein
MEPRLPKARRRRALNAGRICKSEFGESFLLPGISLDISNDDFIRTTEPRHAKVAVNLFFGKTQRFWKNL